MSSLIIRLSLKLFKLVLITNSKSLRTVNLKKKKHLIHPNKYTTHS